MAGGDRTIQISQARVRYLRQCGQSWGRIARRLGVSHELLERARESWGWPVNRGRLDRYTPAEDQILRDMAKAGFAQIAVATRLGRTRCSVAGRASRLGVCFLGGPFRAARMAA